MVEVSYQTSEAVEVEASALPTFVAHLGFATVYGLQFQEAPQPPCEPVAIVNVTGWCAFSDPSPAGLCVMLVGRDASCGILWACCLMAQPRDGALQRMHESLLIAPQVLGKTTQIVIRITGGRFGKADALVAANQVAPPVS